MGIIQSIRQFENPFIPLSFHWSGRYIKTQSVQKLFIHDCYILLFCTTISLDSGGEIASYLFHNSASASGNKRQKLKFNNLYAYFQWKIQGCSWPGINLWILIKKSRDRCRYSIGKQNVSHLIVTQMR
jgi:hypothetical protein